MMQKDYQYRILICDRDDFAVLENVRGKDDLSRCAESGTVSTGTEGRGDGDDLEMREGK